jgi:outer membrane protein assembly factor BamD (BamD/ComL family)
VRRSISTLFISLLLAAAALPSEASAKRIALVIGIDQYDNLSSAQQLKKAVSDSRAVGETFRSLGYDVQQADNVRRLDFLRQWQRFLNRIQPGDDAALFFAGHGVEISGLNFLLPADVPRVASGEEEVLKASGLSLSDLLDQVREKKPQMMLYVVDACRDNPFVKSNGRSIGGTRGLTLVEPPSGTFVMFSAGAGETALDRLSDVDPNPNSVYTRTLLPRLKAPGRIGDIARDVRREVRDLAAKVNHVQTPAFYDEVIGDFCPAGCVVEAKADATALVKPQPAPPDPALEAWNATKVTDSVDVLTAYVAKYGNSFYAELAKARIEELKRKQLLAAGAPANSQLPGPDPALAAWNSVKDTENVDVLETFIGTYPLSFYAELARVHLKDLKKKQLAALVAPPAPKILPPPPDPALDMWNASKNTNSVNVLEAFVGKYPQSFYAELAKARIEELKRKQQVASLEPSVPQPPKADPSLDAWNAAKTSENVSVIQAFVDKYPLSFYAEIAKARIEELKQKQLETAQKAIVRGIQQTLKNVECYGGAVDGVWSGSSKKALNRFNRLAKLNPALEEPGPATLETLQGWKGQHCAVEKVATPGKENATPANRPSPAKVTKRPLPTKIAKTPPPTKATKPARVVTTPRLSPPKERSVNKPASIDTSVYCHQGCAGGFENVLKSTATNPGMKR